MASNAPTTQPLDTIRVSGEVPYLAPGPWIDVGEYDRLGLEITAAGAHEGQMVAFTIEIAASDSQLDNPAPSAWERLTDDGRRTGYLQAAVQMEPGHGSQVLTFLDVTPIVFQYVRICPILNRLKGRDAGLWIRPVEIPVTT